MKMLNTRWPLILALLGFTLAFAFSTQAAQVKRARTNQTLTFQTDSNTKIMVGSNHSSSLANLKVGDHVSVGYAQDDGAQVARRIVDGVPHKPHTPGTTPNAHSKPHAKTSGLLHAHGVIRAIDLQAGTVTIAHK